MRVYRPKSATVKIYLGKIRFTAYIRPCLKRPGRQKAEPGFLLNDLPLRGLIRGRFGKICNCATSREHSRSVRGLFAV